MKHGDTVEVESDLYRVIILPLGKYGDKSCLLVTLFVYFHFFSFQGEKKGGKCVNADPPQQ